MKKIIVGFVLFLTILPVFASAYFTDANIMEELQSQIASLVKQVQQLQARLAQMQGVQTAKWCHTFNIDLKIGDNTYDEISALNEALQKEGFNPGESGLFNEAMASAIVGFQEKYKSEILTPIGLSHGTGYLGARTRAKLNVLYGCGNANQTSTTKTIKIYLIDSNSGGSIGCGDNLVAIEKPLLDLNSYTPLKDALTQLINYKTGDGSGLYNAFATDNLSLNGVSISNGEATINLSGSHTGAACDTPRIKAQLKKTAMQFPNVNKVLIFINSVLFDKATSASGL